MHGLTKHCNRALTPPVMRGQIATAVAMIPNVANALGNCCPLPDAHLRLRDSAHAFTEFLIYPLAALWLKHNTPKTMTTQLYALTDAWCITPATASPHQATTTFRHVWFLWTAFQGGERMHINNTPCRITTVVAVSGICRHAATNVLTSSGCQAMCNMQTIFLTSCPSIGY